MLDDKSFKDIESYITDEDKRREEVINRSRIILKNSKSAIYSIHRKDFASAKKLLSESDKIIKELKKLIAKHPHLKMSMDNAMEEYCEAYCFYIFVTEKRVPTYLELSVDPFMYLGGLSDLTGELGRKSVLEAIAKNKSEVHDIRELVDEIHGLFSKLDLRNGELRKKSDSIKWNLQKIEEVLHDLVKKE